MRYGLSFNVTQTAPVVAVAEAELHLRVDHDTEGDLVAELVDTATELAENFLNRALRTQTVTLTLDEFPCDGQVIRLPKAPLVSVTSITYVDTAGATQTWSSAEYRVDTAQELGRIEPAYGYFWPVTRSVTSAVVVTYVAGYTSASAVPAPIKHAIKLYLTNLYENRASVVTGTISSEIASVRAESLLWPYRILEAA